MPINYRSTQPASDLYPWIRIAEEKLRERANALDILVAEDNTFSQTLIVRLLQKMGHRVTIATNGAEAVVKYKRKSFDLIFMDINMPEMNGMEAATCIRKMEEKKGVAHIPVVAMTAHAKEGGRQRCFATGMDHYMAKPVSMQGLEGVLQIFSDPADILQSNRPGWNQSAVLARAGGDEQLLKTLMTVFAKSRVKLIAEIQKGLREGKPELLEHAAHILKEQLSYLGACELSETARRLEGVCKERNMLGAARFAELLQSQMTKFGPRLTGLPG